MKKIFLFITTLILLNACSKEPNKPYEQPAQGNETQNTVASGQEKNVAPQNILPDYLATINRPNQKNLKALEKKYGAQLSGHWEIDTQNAEKQILVLRDNGTVATYGLPDNTRYYSWDIKDNKIIFGGSTRIANDFKFFNDISYTIKKITKTKLIIQRGTTSYTYTRSKELKKK